MDLRCLQKPIIDYGSERVNLNRITITPDKVCMQIIVLLIVSQA